MRLSDLLKAAGLEGRPVPDSVIEGLESDSRKIQPGFLFAALPGTQADGRAYIESAIKQGATAILAAKDAKVEGAVLITTPNPRRDLALLAAAFYAPAPQTAVAVTGTNGKTSTTQFTAQIWNVLKEKAVAIGTLGIEGAGIHLPGSLTTPDPITLHRDLQKLANQGITHFAIEASSIGLDQHRLDGLKLKAAGFTYLGRDHLDYHKNEAGYFRAKAGLFDRLLAEGTTAVLNADTPEYEPLHNIIHVCKHNLITYGYKAADLRLKQISIHPQGLALDIDVMGKSHSVIVPVSGTFQAYNILCALGLCIGAGADPEKAVAALPQLVKVRGRLERIGESHQGAPVYVDYAHTPDALEAVLTSLRPHTARRLIVVFGCGGNRDTSKRPEMGRIAARLADAVYVTDDNPRREEAAAIRGEIMAACPGAFEINDRAKAIQEAVETLQAGDTLLIAGKGHEQGQIVGDKTLPFDDAEVARSALLRLKESV